MLDGCPVQKRAKTFPLSHGDEPVDQPPEKTSKQDKSVARIDHRLTAPAPSTESELVENFHVQSQDDSNDSNVKSPPASPAASYAQPASQNEEELPEVASLPPVDDPASASGYESDIGEGPFEYHDDEQEDSIDDWFANFDPSNIPPDLEEGLAWEPPPEPFMPENPYGKGRKLTIQKHVACPPYGRDYPDYAGVRDRVLIEELRTTTKVDLCLKHPPMKGETADAPPRALEITKVIRRGDESRAQLVVCRLDDEPADYVAKIYDPLYYGFKDPESSSMPRDVTDEADMDYCREVAAYLELDDALGGRDVPKFHGSWTFQLPIDLQVESATRDVRMMLIERVPGRSLLDVKPDVYPDDVRLDTVARIAEAMERINFFGVRHGDYHVRNVMLCDGDGPKTTGRVVIIDFNQATVFRLDDSFEKYGIDKSKKLEKPRNPIDQNWDGGLYGGFAEWFPSSFEYRLRAMQDWLYERWHKSEEFLPPSQDLEWDEENVPREWQQWF